MIDERVWAEIDLSALAHNAGVIRERLNGVGHMAVVKADAYGHGAVQAARTLEQCGVSYLGVACLSEALELRRSGIEIPILILGYTPAAKLSYLTRMNITQTVFDADYARALSDHARIIGQKLRVHIKADTGMNRLGIRSAREITEILRLPYMEYEGLYTHLSSSDVPDNPPVREQLDEFRKITSEINENFPITHCANSGGVLYYKESWFNMVRTGILMYGASDYDGFRPVMHLRARIAQVKDVAAGECVSYDRTFTAPRGMKVAVVCAGYADGYMRSFSNSAEAVCNGVRVPVIGRVCMDMTMLDVSDAGCVCQGDMVTLFGAHGLSAAELASRGGTIPYEVLCAVSRRVPRVYSGGHQTGRDGAEFLTPRPDVFDFDD